MKTLRWPIVGMIAISASLAGATPPPTVGAHALAYYPIDGGPDPLSIPGISTQPSGSTILTCVARGKINGFTPAAIPKDNKGNLPYAPLSPVHTYTHYQNSGTQLFAFLSATGGEGHRLTTALPADDEITMAVIEVKNGGVIQEVQWNEVPLDAPLTSRSVTTTGPATLIAFWWGDGDVDVAHAATPNNGFVVTDKLLPKGALIQCVVATKTVSAPGTYNVTWDSNTQEGAQLYLVAVQGKTIREPGK